jgi:hypothetical protein
MIECFWKFRSSWRGLSDFGVNSFGSFRELRFWLREAMMWGSGDPRYRWDETAGLAVQVI